MLVSSLYRLAIRQGFVRPCLSEAIIAEYAAVLARPKFAFPPEEIKTVLAYCGTWLNPHALNLAKTHFVAAPVVEFRRFDVRVTCHPLGDVNVAAAFQIIRDTDARKE